MAIGGSSLNNENQTWSKERAGFPNEPRLWSFNEQKNKLNA